MRRNCGYLTLMGGILGGAEFIAIPEKELTLEEIGQALEDAYMRGKSHAMGVIAEGASLKIDEVAAYLESHEIGFEVRVTVLGHVVAAANPAPSTACWRRAWAWRRLSTCWRTKPASWSGCTGARSAR